MQYTPLQAPQQLATATRPRQTTSSIGLRQPQLNTDYITAHNLAASNPPADVLKQHGRYQWTMFQPSNLQPVLSGQPQLNTYSIQVLSESQAPNTITTSTTMDTVAVLTDAYETMNPDPSFNPAFN